MSNTYNVGQQVRLKATFTVNKVLTDPTTITLKVRDPEGNIKTFLYSLTEVVKEGTGVYYKDFIFYGHGEWFYRWAGTGACQAADETRVTIERSHF